MGALKMIKLPVILFQNNNRRTDFHEFAKRWHSTTGEGKNSSINKELSSILDIL